MKNKFFILMFICMLNIQPLMSFAQKTSIHGSVNYHNDPSSPMQGVTLYLKTLTNTILDSTTSNPNGVYTFHNIANGSYIVSATYNQPPLGVGIEDAQLVMLYLNNQITFDVLQKLAADVTGDDTITIADYDTIMNHWLLTGLPFPAGNWVFTDDTIDVSKGKDNPPTTGGSSSGDVGGVFLPGQKPKPMIYPNCEETVTAQTKNSFAIPYTISSHMNIGGMGFVINYPSDLMTINNIKSPFGEIDYKVINDKIYISYLSPCMLPHEVFTGDVIFTIEGTTTDAFIQDKEIALVIDPFFSQLNDKKGKIFAGESVTFPKVVWEASPLGSAGVYPNPASETVNFVFSIEKEGYVHLKVYNATGEIVKQYSRVYQQGMQNINLNTDDLQSGIYFYSILSPENRLMEKGKLMINN